jgi:hypothetical protein
MRRVALAVLAVSLAACGTTVPTTQRATTSSAGGDGLGVSTASGDGSTATSPVTGATDPGTSSTGEPTDVPAPVSSGPAVPGLTGVPEVPASSGGVTKQPPIEIGSYYLEGGTAAVAAAGFGGLVIPDNKPLVDAMTKYLNSKGGLAGRQIKLVWFKYVSGGDPKTQDAAACQAFTQDHHVFVVLGGINSGAGELGPCLTKKGVPLIGANAGGDARYFEKNHRYIYEPGQASFTRGLAALVESQRKAGWFNGKHKIGVVQYESAIYDHAVDDGLVAPLAKLGLKVDQRVKFSGVDNNSIAQGSASAVLKFRSQGIDRVIFMGPGGAAATYFMQTASTQGYHPLYGIWSADSPYVLGITGAKDQLVNSTGIGYQPGLDVASGQDPTATTPAAKACLAYWDSVGFTDHSALNNPLQRAICDVTYTLVRAVNGDVSLTRDIAALEAGYDRLGGTYAPAGTFVIRFRPGSHDAVGGFRRLTYQGGCSCFTYVGATQRLP